MVSTESVLISVSGDMVRTYSVSADFRLLQTSSPNTRDTLDTTDHGRRAYVIATASLDIMDFGYNGAFRLVLKSPL